MTQLFIFIAYMLIGFFFVKPRDMSDFSLTYVEVGSGFFTFPLPILIWILLWILWIPICLIKLILTGRMFLLK